MPDRVDIPPTSWRSYVNRWRAAALRRNAARIRREWTEASHSEALPGGLFGTYWTHGIEGRDAARMQFNQDETKALAHADALDAEAEALDG